MKKEEIRTRLQQLYNVCLNYNLRDLSERIDSQLKLIDDPLRIMIVGEGKSGKSSLLNALVGATVAEVDHEPKTWCISVFASTKGKPYAEIVYKDDIVRTSVDEAKKLMEEYESIYGNKDSVIDISELREIEEIRWYLNIKWPDEDMVIIDTPGFLQGRGNTETVETKIDGIEGVRFIATDGFEKYYSKSDLVLWCFDATDIGAADVKQKLESVKTQDKNIYGIVTKLDKFRSEEEREEAFKRNNNCYRKYIKQCLRSQLPPIKKSHKGEKLERDLKLRNDTVDGIKRCISYLLNDNKAMDLKLKSYEIFCKNIEKLVANYLIKYIDFYYSNYAILLDIKNKVNKELDSKRETSIDEICKILLDKKINFLIGYEYDSLWLQSNEQPKNFADILMTYEKNSGFMDECNLIQKSFISRIKNIVSFYADEIKWNILKIGSHNEINQTEKFQFDLIEKDISISNLEINVQNSIWDKLLDLFDKNGILYKILIMFFGDKRKEKTFDEIRKAFNKEIDSVRNQYRSQIDQNYQNCSNDFENKLEELFRRINGIGSYEVEKTILRIDELMTSMNLYPQDAPYIPYFTENKLIFVRNETLLKIGTIIEENQSENIIDYVRKNYIQKAFKSRLKNDEIMIQRKIAAYDGTKGINMSLETPNFYNDSVLNSILGCWPKIRWGICENTIKDAYETELKKYLKDRDKKRNDYSDKAIERVLDQSLKQFTEPVRLFIDGWQRKCEISFQQCRQYNYYMLPLDWDIKNYFQMDSRYYTNYAIYLFIQFMNDNNIINYVMYQNIPIVTPDGDNASEAMKKLINKMFLKYVTEINSIQKQNNKKWDDIVKQKLEQNKNNLSKDFDEILRLIEEDIYPEYPQYLITMGESKHKKSLSEYIIICGKLSKKQTELLKGKVPIEVSGTDLNIPFSDGTSIYDGVKKYIQDKSKNINYMVKEKMLNGR